MLLNFNMMKNKIIYTIIFSLLIFGYACEKVIEIDIEDAKIKIVANSIIEPDSIVRVNVTRSRHILDNASIIPLNDAEVKLFENDILVGTLVYTSRGNFEIDYYPQIGNEYRIELTHPDFDDVSANTIIPQRVTINDIDTLKTFNEDGYEVYNFYVNFTDPENQENYYYLSMYNKFMAEIWDENLITYDTLYVGPDTTIVDITQGGYRYSEIIERLYFDSDDLIFEEYHPGGNGRIFSDEIIDGNSYTLKASVNHWSFYSDSNNVIIELHTINKDLYRYLTSYSRHNYSSGDPFAEPINVFTNISNGIGIFGGSSVDKDSITISGSFGYIYYE